MNAEYRDIFIGKDKEGNKYYLTVQFSERENGITVQHKPIESYQRVSFTGTVIRKYGSLTANRGIDSMGQNAYFLLTITEPAEGYSIAKVRKIENLWNRFHLNDTLSHCAHQDSSIKWDQVNPCPVTGYKAGSAWLVDPLSPEDIVEIVNTITAKEKVSA